MLKALLLRKKIDEKNKQLEALRTKTAEFEKRENELTQAFNEITEETTAEERSAVEEEINKFDEEKKEHDDAIAQLNSEIEDAEKELAEIEKTQENKEPTKEEQPVQAESEERKVKINMEKRFKNFTMEERSAFVEREAVKTFIHDVRSMMEKRSVTGAELLIPNEVLPLIRTEIETGSKLLKHVNVRKVAGTARQTIIGNAPEGIWTEMCGELKELGLSFSKVEVDGYKVGGFIPVCNSVLEDSDVDLAAEIFEAIGAGIGYALDKAIVYGTGTKMPTGFAATAIKGKTNDKDGVVKSLIKAFGAVKHARGDKFFIMNNQTYMNLVAETFNLNNGVATVSTDGGLYVLGGAVEVLDFIPNNEILGGYGDCYLLAERAGVKIGQSTEVQYIQDNTVFKGTARYDGKPLFNDAFVAFSTTATDPTAAIDTAHPFAGQSAE